MTNATSTNTDRFYSRTCLACTVEEYCSKHRTFPLGQVRIHIRFDYWRLPSVVFKDEL